MKINDVEKLTGLTQKAIRLYESQGLLKVSRDENGYRNYSEEDVKLFRNIKALRGVGISISDIKLYIYGVLRLDELIDKRKNEILKESGINSENYRRCELLSGGLDGRGVSNDGILNENESMKNSDHGRLSVGIDIGTTTVSAVVYDIDGRE